MLPLDLRNEVARTYTDPVQWLGSERLSCGDSACVLSLYHHTRGNTHSSLPSPPPSCAWKPPEMNGPYRGLMRPLVCICFLCEFTPELRHVNVRDGLCGFPASSRGLGLMWHKQSSGTRADHDRGRMRRSVMRDCRGRTRWSG